MVTIHPVIEKCPLIGHRLSQGIGRGLEVGSQNGSTISTKTAGSRTGKKNQSINWC